ncbi:MAG: hypothetical protein CL993_04780 [Euryarchaeota archaeon]|nr:hypothetical protein [Euryarchaeota archaeon]
MIDEITDFVLDWADGFGLIGLAIVSSTEAAFQPVPPDLLVMPMSLSADGPLELFLIFSVATLSSVLGSLGGYAIGFYGGRPLLERFASTDNSEKLDNLVSRYGSAGIFIAAVSPIPYKALAWTAGAGKMNIRIFIVAGLIGRGIRFGLEVTILGFYGDEFLSQLENPLAWLILGIFSIFIYSIMKPWWNKISSNL